MDGDQMVLVTGGSGFLGGWCLVELLQRGYRARTTIRDLSREREVRASVRSLVEGEDRLEVRAADLTRDQGWAEAIEGCDHVLHVASPFPAAQPKDPILGARVVHLAAKEVLLASEPRVFFTTSHFDGYPAVLVRLERIGVEDLTEVIVEAWLARAPARLAKAYVAEFL